ncbi:hypothetical protein L208DRAFT_887761 [Tricholoma matsutake]|nr:hypothetical protein L208DRAFT_887761 [Tricholoma matsutake 945]
MIAFTRLPLQIVKNETVDNFTDEKICLHWNHEIRNQKIESAKRTSESLLFLRAYATTPETQ